MCFSYRGNDELSGEQADGGERAVSDERERREGVEDGVDVSEALKPEQTALRETIPERTVPAEENLYRAQSPPQYLVQPVGEVDRR